MTSFTNWTDYEQFGDKLKEISDEIITGEFISATKYTGFDPRVTQEKLESRRQATKKTEATFMKDLVKMIFLFLIRGTAIDKMVGKSTEAGKKLIKALKTDYTLVSNLSGSNSGADKVNLSRVAAAYPTVTVSLLKNQPEVLENRPISHEVMQKHIDGFPKVFMSSITASVISNNARYITKEILDQIISAISLYGGLETQQINQKFKNDRKGALLDSRKYVNSAYFSTVLTDEQKIEICSSDLMDEVFVSFAQGNVVLTEAVKNAAIKFRELTE